MVRAVIIGDGPPRTARLPSLVPYRRQSFAEIDRGGKAVEADDGLRLGIVALRRGQQAGHKGDILLLG